MLTAELTNFTTKITNIIRKASEKAAESAFNTTYEPPELISHLNENGGIPSQASLDQMRKDVAKNFGIEFGKVFSQEVGPDLAKAIMEYIQKADIHIEHVPTSLTSPTGSVTGKLIITPSTANIKIL